MSAESEKPDEVEVEVEAEVTEVVVDETTLEETPVEPTPEADAADEEAPAEESVAEKPKRTRAKKADAPAEEAPKPADAKKKPAAKPATGKKQPAPTAERPVVRAHAKYVRTSARKARLVCDHIRGKSVTEARAILAYTPRAVAEDWQKLLESAVANAEHNHELLGDDLQILSVTADEGPTLKRFRPRAMGRASAIRKRTSHLSIALTPKEQ
jgi:ribosomal protein L22